MFVFRGHASEIFWSLLMINMFQSTPSNSQFECQKKIALTFLLYSRVVLTKVNILSTWSWKLISIDIFLWQCKYKMHVTANILFSVSNFCTYLLSTLLCGLKGEKSNDPKYVLRSSNLSSWVRNNLLLAEKVMTSRNICQI